MDVIEIIELQIEEIQILSEDLRYVKNKELIRCGIERIQYMAKQLKENLEYLEEKKTTKE